MCVYVSLFTTTLPTNSRNDLIKVFKSEHNNWWRWLPVWMKTARSFSPLNKQGIQLTDTMDEDQVMTDASDAFKSFPSGSLGKGKLVEPNNASDDTLPW